MKTHHRRGFKIGTPSQNFTSFVDARVAPSRNNRHGDLPSPSLEAHPWAVGAAFETSVRFLDEGDALRAETPHVGEVARLELHYPFQEWLGHPFWALYEHPYGYWNGYLDGSGEARHLAAMRFVRCRLLPCTTLPAPGSYETLTLEAEILAVLGPDDLLALRPSYGNAEAAINSVNWRPQTNSDGRLRIIDSNIESDVVNWLLLATVGGHVHLLARGESVFHEAAVAFGNRPLTEVEVAKLVSSLSTVPQPAACPL